MRKDSCPASRPAALSLSLLLVACGGGTRPTGTPVTSLADSGPGSLREVLAAAKDGDTLRFTAGGTVTLASPITVDRDVTLLAGGVTLDAAGKGRALEVAAGADVTLKGGTLKGGVGTALPASPAATSVAGHWAGPPTLNDRSETPVAVQTITAQADPVPTYGGLILNSGSLSLDGVTVTGGKANLGGGIANLEGGTLILKGGTNVTGNDAEGFAANVNTASGGGGGIYNAGTLTLEAGSVGSNTARYSGGGIRSSATGKLIMQGGSVSGNACTYPLSTTGGAAGGCTGGGIYTTGDLTLTGGTISNNTATYFGGGVTVQARLGQDGKAIFPSFILSGGTIEGNRTGNENVTGGGGIWTSGILTMTGGAVRGNASYAGGGILTNADARIMGGTIEGNAATYGAGAFLSTPTTRSSTVTFGDAASVKGNNAGEAGGGLQVNRAVLTMTGGTVQDNTALHNGGGITLGNTDSTIQGGVISRNKVTSTKDGGGGVRVYSDARLTLAGGEITGNTAGKTGGGMTVGGQVTMTGGSISDNTALSGDDHQGGGGVRLYAGAKMTASGGTISGNKARWGAGVNLDGPYETSPTAEFTLAGAVVSGNQITDPSNVGGGFFNGGKLTITSGSVTGNAATRSGGGVFNRRGASYAQTGGTVSGNSPDNVSNE